MKSPSSENSTIDSKRSAIAASVMPRIEQLRWMLSRPLNSGWKPAPNSSREATRPCTSTCPVVGAVIPVRSLSRVLLPAPFSPMMPTVEPCGMSR